MEPRLIVHGGAWNIPDELESDHIKGVQRAVAEVYPKLQNGISALDAVEEAVKILEQDASFDAGRGAFLNAKGEIELDAMIMDGATLNFGAVAAIRNILHPITVARIVMENSEHCLLVGSGAQDFSQQMGISQLNPTELLTSRELSFYEEIKNDPDFTTKKPFEISKKGTVGAVALDRKGNLVAGTSTGGTPRKLPGRVGDTPIIGAGTYADNQCGAASATGWGESIMKVLLSKTACDYLKVRNAEDSAKLAIQVLKQRVKGLGGIILIDKNGNYGFAHNTSKMAFAYAQSGGKIIASIKHVISEKLL